MAYIHHHVKRLQPTTNSQDHRSPLPDDENVRESIQNFTISNNSNITYSRPFEPGPNQARRGGGVRGLGRAFYSSVPLPKRTINYDLAESFVDHSTNPLSSDLYKIRFKHSTKQWPGGRFVTYKDKIDKGDGNIIEVVCTNTFDTVAKRKYTQEQKSNTLIAPVVTTVVDPIAQEHKKKLADKQTNVYNQLYGVGKIPKFSSAIQIKKSNAITDAKQSSTLNSLLSENQEDQQC